MRATVFGLALDPQSRCAHYHSTPDIIAIKMWCCKAYYACRECHDELVDHQGKVCPKAEWDKPAVLCGACGVEISVRDYMGCGDQCPACAASFNPGCRSHHHLYFGEL